MPDLTRWMKRNTKKAKPKKLAKPSAKKTRPTHTETFGWEQARVFVIPFLVVVSLSAASYGWWAGEPHLINYVNQHHQTAIQVKFTGSIVAVDGVQADLEHIVNENISTEPVGSHVRKSLQETRQKLIATGWFDPQNLHIRRDLITDAQSPTGTRDIITVDGPFRQPFALVRNGNHDYLIDRAGFRLPVQYNINDVEALPVFVGVNAPPPTIGNPWAGRDLVNGIDLLNYLEAAGPAWLAQVREIDVRNAQGVRRGEPHLVLVTKQGYRIAWGRAVGDEKGIDQPPTDKIRVLDDYAKQRSGRIGDPMGLLRIDLPLATLDRANDG